MTEKRWLTICNIVAGMCIIIGAFATYRNLPELIAICVTIGAVTTYGIYYFTKLIDDKKNRQDQMAEEKRAADLSRKEAEETNVGRLVSKIKSTVNFPVLEIGNSGTLFMAQSVTEDPLVLSFAGLIPGSNFEVVFEDYELKVSLIIRNNRGEILTELDRNEWKLNPVNWDRNYTQDLLEVKNPEGEIILQLQALPDRVRVHAKMYDINGRGLIFTTAPPGTPGSGAYIVVVGEKTPWDMITFNPLFCYPSKLHLGELRNPNEN